MSPQPLHPLDAMSVALGHHDLLLENESVRVLDTRLDPGERTPIHTHQWPAVLYIQSWSDFIRYDADGNVLLDSRTMSSAPAVGSALWAAPLQPHFVRNVGEHALHIVAIELKES